MYWKIYVSFVNKEEYVQSSGFILFLNICNIFLCITDWRRLYYCLSPNRSSWTCSGVRDIKPFGLWYPLAGSWTAACSCLNIVHITSKARCFTLLRWIVLNNNEICGNNNISGRARKPSSFTCQLKEV